MLSLMPFSMIPEEVANKGQRTMMRGKTAHGGNVLCISFVLYAVFLYIFPCLCLHQALEFLCMVMTSEMDVMTSHR